MGPPLATTFIEEPLGNSSRPTTKILASIVEPDVAVIVVSYTMISDTSCSSGPGSGLPPLIMKYPKKKNVCSADMNLDVVQVFALYTDK